MTDLDLAFLAASEAAQLRRMASLAEQDGRADLAAKFRAMADAVER